MARANRRITNSMLAAAFTARDPWNDRFFGRGFGLWFYNSHYGCYTFLPWYYGWRSPYGTRYSTPIYNPYAGRGYTGSGGTTIMESAQWRWFLSVGWVQRRWTPGYSAEWWRLWKRRRSASAIVHAEPAD